MASENHLLRVLEPAALKLLQPHMKTITIEHGEVLHSASREMEFAYFPKSTIISVLARTEQGQTAETSIVGREGMIGSSAIHGIMTSFAESIVQVPGEAVRIPAPEVYRVGKTSEGFRRTVALFDRVARAIAAIDGLSGTPSGGKPRRAMAAAMQKAPWQQRHQTDPGILRTNAWRAADHHQPGGTHVAECRPYSDRARPDFHSGPGRPSCDLLRLQ